MSTPVQIVVAAIPTLAALFLLSPMWVVLAFIVLGQGHFVLSYLYQYRAGKLTRQYALRYLIGVALIALFLFLTHGSLAMLILLIAIAF